MSASHKAKEQESLIVKQLRSYLTQMILTYEGQNQHPTRLSSVFSLKVQSTKNQNQYRVPTNNQYKFDFI